MFFVFILLSSVFSEDAPDESLKSTKKAYFPLKPRQGFFHFQSFTDPNWTQTWQKSTLPNVTGQWELQSTGSPQSYADEKMIFMTTEEAYYGLSSQFPSALNPQGKTLVVQYETRFQDTLRCGGAYIKLFHKDNFSPADLSNETRYIIMFGPDKCDPKDKVHFIFRHKSPKTGLYEEKHLTDPPPVKSDKLNHLYTLIIRPDNSFEILIDTESARKGSLFEDFSPSVIPPKEIDDPTDVKPSDWVENETIEDPNAVKPDDWDENAPEFIKDPERLNPPEGWLLDEPKEIPDPKSPPPDDWSEEMFGKWEAPLIPNPKCEEVGCGEYEVPLIRNPQYKGKWTRPIIPNPDYKGPWKPRQIPNPNYFDKAHPAHFEPIIGAGFELWAVQKNIGFTNVYIGTSESAVKQWNKEHFLAKQKQQQEEDEGLTAPKTELKRTMKPSPKQINRWVQTVTDFYEKNQIVAIAGVVTVIAFLVLLIVLCCGGTKEVQPDVYRRTEKVKPGGPQPRAQSAQSQSNATTQPRSPPVESQPRSLPVESQPRSPPAESQPRSPPAESQPRSPPVESQRPPPPKQSEPRPPPAQTQPPVEKKVETNVNDASKTTEEVPPEKPIEPKAQEGGATRRRKSRTPDNF